MIIENDGRTGRQLAATDRNISIMMMIKMTAIIGDKSIIPMRGMTDRIGPIIGSVSSINAREIGFWPRGSNHDKIARPMIANIMIWSTVIRI